MPQKVKMWGSVGILTSIFTGLITTTAFAFMAWITAGTLEAKSNKLEVSYVKEQMETMNESLVEIVAMQHEKDLVIIKHELRLEYCEEHQRRCEEFLNDTD